MCGIDAESRYRAAREVNSENEHSADKERSDAIYYATPSLPRGINSCLRGF